MEKHIRAYLECVLWSSLGADDQPLDRGHTIENFPPAEVQFAETAWRDFRAQLSERALAAIDTDPEQAGHDLWLTRCRHGAGFWDGDWPGDIEQELTDAAHALGESDVYVGDDGGVYFTR